MDFGTCPVPTCGILLDPDGSCIEHGWPDAEVVPMPEPDASPSGSRRQRGRKGSTSGARSRAAEPRPVRAVPSDPARLLHDLHDWLTSYVAFPSDHAAVAVALWAAHTHLVHSFGSTPRLAVLSPEKECGKTRVLELLELVCAGAETLTSASAAYLFRRIGSEGAGPVTLLLDEADAIWKRGKFDETAEALRSIVNAGHRKGATAGRVEMNGQAATLVRFPVYAPAALAAIRDLPDTILSRAVVMHMRRRAQGQIIRPYRERTTRPEGEALRDLLAAWAANAEKQVGDPWPVMPPGVDDRPGDVWEPLLMVADLAGGDWPDLARSACVALVKGARDDSQTIGTRLLADLRDMFATSNGLFGHADVLFTSDILKALNALDEAPWGGWHDGEGIGARDLANLLKPYDIRPRQVRIGGTTAKGYHRAELADQWSRYAPGSLSETSETSETPLASHVSDVSDVSDKEPDGPDTPTEGASHE
jgi:Protein of unknown function (DUF3631)